MTAMGATTEAQLERGQCDLNDLVTIERAHDVRTLRGCAHCGGLGHKTQMLEGSPFADEKSAPWFHGRCFAAKFGEKALLNMGRRQLDRLCIGDIGVRLMSAMIDRLSGGVKP
jgi:hypothetical protein